MPELKRQHFNLEEKEAAYHKGVDVKVMRYGQWLRFFFPAHVIALIGRTEGDKGYLHRKPEWNEEVSLKHKFKKAIKERGRTRNGTES